MANSAPISTRDSGRVKTGKALAGGPGVPQRVRVRGIAAEQEVGGLGVADLPAFVLCGGKGTLLSTSPGWGLQQEEALPPTSCHAHLPTPEPPQVLTDTTAEPTTLPLEHGALFLPGSWAGLRDGNADWSRVKLDDWFPKGKRGKGLRK